MVTLNHNKTIKYLSLFSLLVLLGGCGTTTSVYDTSTCTERGGKLAYMCIGWNSNGSCHTNQQVCSGGMTHDAYEKQQQRTSRDISPTPLPVLSEEEKAAQKLERWEKRLDLYATEKRPTRNAHKYPKLSWISSRWCLKGSGSKIPASYYNVEQTGIGGSLKIHYRDIDVKAKLYTHVEINGNYYDLWDGSGYSWNLLDERGRRLEKISDEEFALVYIFKGPRLPKDFGGNKEKMKKFAIREGQQVGPEKHIKNPQVFVKCD